MISNERLDAIANLGNIVNGIVEKYSVSNPPTTGERFYWWLREKSARLFYFLVIPFVAIADGWKDAKDNVRERS